MGFIERIFHPVKQLAFGFGDLPEIREDKLPVFNQWMFSARMGQPRGVDIHEIRQFAKSPWAQMALNTIKKQVETIDYDFIETEYADEGQDYTDLRNELERFFKYINSDGDCWDDIANYLITDLGEIDAAAVAKVFTAGSYTMDEVPIYDSTGRSLGTEVIPVLKDPGQRELVEVRIGDGSTFLKQIDVYRRLLAYYQYSFKHPRNAPVRFQPDEVIYLQMNKRPYSVYGFSPIQSVQQVLDLLIQSTKHNKDFFSHNAMPAALVSLPGVSQDSIKDLEKKWTEKMKRNAHKVLFQGTPATIQPLGFNNKDMEWLEGQKWYFHLVFGAFGVSPAEAGFYENSNRSTQEGQERVTVKNAVKPYLKQLERAAYNIICERLGTDKPPLKLEYQPKDHVVEEIEFNQNMAMLDRQVMTINEYRAERGLDSVEWGDVPVAQAMMEQTAEQDSQDDEEEAQRTVPFTEAFERFLEVGK